MLFSRGNNNNVVDYGLGITEDNYSLQLHPTPLLATVVTTTTTTMEESHVHAGNEGKKSFPVDKNTLPTKMTPAMTILTEDAAAATSPITSVSASASAATSDLPLVSTVSPLELESSTTDSTNPSTLHTHTHTEMETTTLHREKFDDNDDDDDYDDDEIQKDAATDRVANVVYCALIFFMGLSMVAVLLVLSLIANYGFVALVIVTLLIVAVLGLAWFVHRTLWKEAKLQPVRRKIRRWKALTTAVVLEEVRNFQLEWNEHLLLTNGDYDLYDDDNDDEEQDGEDFTPDNHHQTASTATPKKKGKKRAKSILFKFVKPFLRRGGRRRRRNTKEADNPSPRQQMHTDTSSNPYQAPEVV